MTSQRNLTGLNLGASRNLTGLSPNNITISADNPILANTVLNNTNITIDISTLDSATLGFTNNLLVQQGTVLKQTTLNNLRDLIAPAVEYDLPIVFAENTIKFSIADLGNATLALGDNIFVQQGTALKKTTFTNIKTLIDSDTQYSFTNPLVLTGTDIKLGTLTNFGTAGQIFRSTGTDIEYSNECNLSDIFTTASSGTEKRFYEYTEAQTLITIGNAVDNIVFYNSNSFTISMPVVSSNSTLITADSNSKATITTIVCDRFNNSNSNAIMLYDGGTDILTLGNNAIANLKFNQKNTSGSPQTFTLPRTGTGGELGFTISVSSPLSKSGNTIDLDFSGLINVNTLAGSDEFLISTDGVKTFRHITFSTLIVETQANLNFPTVNVVAPIVKVIDGLTTTISYDIDTMFQAAQSQVENAMLINIGIVNGSSFLNRKITGLMLQSYINHQGTSFGTHTGISGTRIFGRVGATTTINGSSINLHSNGNEIRFSTDDAGNTIQLVINEDSGGIVRNNGLSIAGYFQATGKVVLGNSTNNTEVFGNNIEITGGVATAGSSTVSGFGGFSRRLYSYNRGLYLYQSPWGGSGSSSVGRASWLITCGFQQFRLEFLITSTGGSLEILAYINGNGQYIDYSFTGQHKSKSVNDTIYDNIEDYVGLICYATGEYSTYDFDNETCNSDKEGITINDSMPVIDLTTTKKDKRVYGVISNKEDTNRVLYYGHFVSKVPSANDANRVIVNGIGEGSIWIVNTNGNFENGDYIQSSNVAGYGEKQDSEFLANYTVAKITCDCDFDINSNKYKSKMVGDNIACFVGAIYYCG